VDSVQDGEAAQVRPAAGQHRGDLRTDSQGRASHACGQKVGKSDSRVVRAGSALICPHSDCQMVKKSGPGLSCLQSARKAAGDDNGREGAVGSMPAC